MTHDTLRIIFLNILGWTGFAFADTAGKYLSDTYHVSQLLVCASGLAWIMITVFIFMHKGIAGFKTNKLKLHLLRSFFIVGTSYAVVNAFARIPLADFYGIVFTAPFMILLIAAFIFKEKVGIHRWGAVCVGFAGVLILAGPKFAEFEAGYIYALVSVLFVALNSVFARKISSGEYFAIYGFYPPIFVVTFNSPMALMHFNPISGEDLLIFLFYGVFIACGLIFTAFSIAQIKEMAIIAPFQYIQIIWGVLFGYLLFQDVPSKETYMGLMLIIGAGLFMIFREHQAHQKLQRSE